MLHALIVLALPTALALTPPSGWMLSSPDRAERVPGDPLQGEILSVTALDGSASTLSLRLLEQGLSVQQSALDGDRLNLVLSDGRLGRASWEASDGCWLVLLVDPSHASQMDPDALLHSARDTSETVASGSAWGGDVEVISGGGDGSPWGPAEGEPEASASSSGWVDAAAVSSWSHDASMLGIWECSMMRGGAPAQLTFTFEADGTVRLEQQISGRTEHHVGQWSTRDGALQLLSLPGVDTTAINMYQSMGGTLQFTYDRTRLTLYRR